MVTYRDRLPTRRRSPIQVLTGPDVEQPTTLIETNALPLSQPPPVHFPGMLSGFQRRLYGTSRSSLETQQSCAIYRNLVNNNNNNNNLIYMSPSSAVVVPKLAHLAATVFCQRAPGRTNTTIPIMSQQDL